MKRIAEEPQEAIRHYLLGQLSQEQLPQLEERILTDDEFSEELGVVEDELIDEYLSGELSQSERAQFESHFLCTPERLRKVRFGSALRKYVSEGATAASNNALPAVAVADPPKRKRFFLFGPGPALGYALAAIIGVALIAGAWLIFSERLHSGQSRGNIFAVQLVPGGTRDSAGGELTKFAIPADTGTLRLNLELAKDSYSSYGVSVLDGNGNVILQKSQLRSQAAQGHSTVVVDLPANSIPPDDYQVKLSGTTADGKSEAVAAYLFRVLRR